MNPLLQLEEIRRRRGIDSSRSGAVATSGVVSAVDRLRALKERVEAGEDENALLALQGVMKGANPHQLQTVAGDGTFQMHREEKPAERAARGLALLKEKYGGTVARRGDAAVLGMAANAAPEADPLAPLREMQLKAKIKTEDARRAGVNVDTQEKRLEGQRKAVKGAAGKIPLSLVGSASAENAVERVDALTATLRRRNPDLSEEEIEGILSSQAYVALDAQIKRNVAKEKEEYNRLQKELANERATKRAMTTGDTGLLNGKREAISELEDLKTFAVRPGIRKNWKRFSVGANEIARVTGEYIRGVIDLGEYQNAQRKLQAEFDGDAEALELIRRTKKAVFIVGRGLNGPGVMTEGDLAFWTDALMNTDGSLAAFDNAVNRELGVLEDSYLKTVDSYKGIVHRIGGDHEKYKRRYSRNPNVIAKADKPKDTLFGAKTVLEVKDAVGGSLQSLSSGALGAKLGGPAGDIAFKAKQEFDEIKENVRGGVRKVNNAFETASNLPKKLIDQLRGEGLHESDLPEGVRTPEQARQALPDAQRQLKKAIQEFGTFDKRSHEAARRVGALNQLL